jgi:hypothetical protein
MVQTDLRAHLQNFGRTLTEQPVADLRVFSQRLLLCAGDRVTREQDIVGNADLADIVQRGRNFDAFHNFRRQLHFLSDHLCVSRNPDDPEALLMRVVLRQVGSEHDGLTFAITELPHRRSDFSLKQLRTIFQEQVLIVQSQQITATGTAFVCVIRFEQEIRHPCIKSSMTNLGVLDDRYHHDRHFCAGWQSPQPANRFDAIYLIHLVISQNEVWNLDLRPLNCFEGVREHLHADIRVDAVDDFRKNHPGSALIVDNENMSRSDREPLATGQSVPQIDCG